MLSLTRVSPERDARVCERERETHTEDGEREFVGDKIEPNLF